MKYVLSFLSGVLLTSICFIYYLKNRLAHTTTPVASTTQEIVVDNSATIELPDGFITFYEKFHRDSLFQLTHTRFPLEGIPEREAGQKNVDDFYWQKESWTLHRSFNAMEGSYIRDFLPVGKDMVIEKIRHAKANYGMQRHFSKDGDDWYLIFYAAMNELPTTE